MNRRSGAVSSCVLTLLTMVGCTDQQGWGGNKQAAGSSAGSPGHEVGRVICFYQPPVWLNLDIEGDPNPEGFKFNMYLVSRKTGRGIIAKGVLQSRMYVTDRLPDETTQRREVCAWTRDLDQVVRTTREYELGWGYQPRFYWGDADVLGRSIEIVTWYEAPNGRKVYARTHSERVPARK